MQKCHLLDIGSQRKQTYQRTPGTQLGVGQGHQSLSGRRGRVVTLVSGQLAPLCFLLMTDGRFWVMVATGSHLMAFCFARRLGGLLLIWHEVGRTTLVPLCRLSEPFCRFLRRSSNLRAIHD